LAIIAAAGVFAVSQIQYIFDPGLRDLPVREKIRNLTTSDCAEIVAECEALYSKEDGKLVRTGEKRASEVPPSGRAIGYDLAFVGADYVKFLAGAGGFSNVGSILITCRIDPKSGKAAMLYLDDGRRYDPVVGGFTRPAYTAEQGAAPNP